MDVAPDSLQETDLIIVAGRPGAGKTALAVKAARSLCEAGEAALIVLAEMPADSFRRRLAALVAGVDEHKLRTGAGTAEEFESFRRAFRLIDRWPLQIIDRPGIAVESADKFDQHTIGGSVRRLLEAGKRPRIVYVDHIGRLGDDPTPAQVAYWLESRIPAQHQRGGVALRQLKALATEVRVPVVALAQLRRTDELPPRFGREADRILVFAPEGGTR